MIPGSHSRRLALIALITVAVLSPLHDAFADADSVRAEIARLIQSGRQQMSEMTAAKLDSSITLYEVALTLIVSNFGRQDTAIASVLTQLSLSYYWKSDYARSNQLISDALHLLETELGPDDPALARPLRIMGDNLAWQGRIAEAEPAYLRGLKVLKSVDTTDESYENRRALLHNNLGLLYITQRRFDQADSAFRRAERIWTKLYGENSRWHAAIHQNMGTMRSIQGRREESLEHLRISLSLNKTIYGPDHLYVAHAEAALADVLMSVQRLDEAAGLFADAIRIQTLAFSGDAPASINTLYKLATLETRRGNWKEAVKLAERVESMSTATAGFYSPREFVRLSNLSKIYAGAGMDAKALATFRAMIDTRRAFIRGAFAYASASQKMRYLYQDPLVDDCLLSWAIEQDTDETRTAALDMILAGKAFAIDALAAEREAAYCSADPELAGKLTHHATVCGAIASLVLDPPDVGSDQGVVDSLAILHRIQDSLEVLISSDCAEFRAELATKNFTANDIALELPADGVLWEIVRYRPYDFRKHGSYPARYASYILHPDSRISVVDMGQAQHIDSLVAELRLELESAPVAIYTEGESATEAAYRQTASQLYNALIAPVESELAGAQRIFLSPDGDLHLVPFEVLCSLDGPYVIEDHEISYLASGRDLLNQEAERAAPKGPVVLVYDPDYDKPAVRSSSPLLTMRGRPIGSTADVSQPLHECIAESWDPLPSTRAEAQMIAATYRAHGRNYTRSIDRSFASEDYLKYTVESPAVLHIATHGHYCSANDGEEEINPLLFSGLALAGANRVASGEHDSRYDDGILTALEASGLNLYGTELVVLSACQTGLGDVVTGEGVFGLRRAFQQAGARSTVMSMFSVPDDATVTLMKRFYRNWLEGASKSSALRDGALSVLRDRRQQHGAAHPLFWGGFILAGDPN